MDLKEHQGKKLFKKFGIPVPKGIVINQDDNLNADVYDQLGVQELVLKAQIPFGKRGKSGGILFATQDEFAAKAEELLNKTIQGFKVNQLWAEEKLAIDKEFYLSTTLSRTDKSFMLVFSPEGGMEIEEIAEKSPGKIIKVPLKDNWKKKFKHQCQDFNLKEKVIDGVIKISSKLLELSKNDVTLAEINPLILTTDLKLIAADSKVTLDDNSLFRHKEYLEEEKQAQTLEEKAEQMGLAYVQLDGDIGVIGNGAGLVMCTLDTLAHFDGSPANFLDIGGGANKEKMTQAVKVVLQNPNCKSLFVNIFGGITKCDEVAQGIVDYLEANSIDIPVTVRLVGTNEQQGQEILNQAGIHFYKNMEKAAKQAVASSKGE
jgi:succinyl-CoA synthetase beta subunit